MIYIHHLNNEETAFLCLIINKFCGKDYIDEDYLPAVKKKFLQAAIQKSVESLTEEGKTFLQQTMDKLNSVGGHS